MNLKKSIVALSIIGSFAATSAFAQNNSTGQITVQGVVPGTWELTVYDINSGYDFNLTDATADISARVGTIHIYTNDSTSAGGHLTIESANAGRLINSSTGPGIAAEHQVYTFDLVDNTLVTNGLTVNATSSLDPATANTFNLLTPATVDFDSEGGTSAAAEGLYDVEITIPGTGRPQASGVYTDTITFTIMDDN
ncbi:MAG: hypothetical protein CL916_15190 [Deltaproteobacteria bacterium]|nr:hypothetical protein [Deltaproteobacteria bacterium]